MQAIHTKYIPASNTKGARIKAYNESNPKGVTVSINYDLDDVGRHAVAAKAFIVKYWTYHNKDSVLTYGGSADGKGYVFCCIDSTIDLKTLEV